MGQVRYGRAFPPAVCQTFTRSFVDGRVAHGAPLRACSCPLVQIDGSARAARTYDEMTIHCRAADLRGAICAPDVPSETIRGLSAMRINRRRVASALTMGLAALLIGSLDSVTVAQSLQLASKDWSTVGGDVGQRRHSILSQINVSNVGRLGGAWVKELDAVTRTPPVISGGLLYTNDATTIYALNPQTGATVWSYKPTGASPARGGVALGHGYVFCGLTDTRVVALDQKTGRLIWTSYIGNAVSGKGESGKPIMINGEVLHVNKRIGSIADAPTYENGVVTLGLTFGDMGVRDKISGLDAATGKVLWNFWVIPSPGAPGSETWPAEGDALQQGGGAVWTTGSADPQLGLVYYGTGNPAPQVGGEVRAGDNLYTSSVVALEAKTGKLKWYFQLTHHDLWEMDDPSSLVLYDARVGGTLRRALGVMRVDGYLFILDRETGKPLFPVKERPVPQDVRQRTAPTQPFPVGADQFGPNCTDPATMPPHSGFIAGCYFDPPYFDRPNVLVPVTTTRQAPLSYDPRTGYLYVMGTVWNEWYRRVENPYDILMSHPPGSSEYGIFAAINVRTDRIVWQRRSPWGLAFGDGALTTAGRLLFFMRGDGNLVACDSRTGRELWRFQTGSLSPSVADFNSGAPLATYEAGGAQYVLAPIGKALWAFKLGGTLPPRPALPPPPTGWGFEGIISRIPDDGAIAIGGKVNSAYYDPQSEHYIDEFAFSPLRARIRPNQPLKFTNYGVKPRTIVSSDGTWTTGAIPPGRSATVKVGKPGSYVFYAKESPFSRGQLIVATPAAGVVSRSTDDGVFSDRQSMRGKTAYLAQCAACHGPDLTGGDQAPALSGEAFLQQWRGLPVQQLYHLINSTMPQNRPHSLSAATYIDITAFLLDGNGMPSGDHDLTTDPAVLKAIAIGDGR